MSAKDRDRLKVLHEVSRRHITQVQAASELGVSSRWVWALLEKMKREGDGAVVHRLRGRPSNRKLRAAFEPGLWRGVSAVGVAPFAGALCEFRSACASRSPRTSNITASWPGTDNV
jgi:biotin operon repressor